MKNILIVFVDVTDDRVTSIHEFTDDARRHPHNLEFPWRAAEMPTCDRGHLAELKDILETPVLHLAMGSINHFLRGYCIRCRAPLLVRTRPAAQSGHPDDGHNP